MLCSAVKKLKKDKKERFALEDLTFSERGRHMANVMIAGRLFHTLEGECYRNAGGSPRLQHEVGCSWGWPLSLLGGESGGSGPSHVDQ